MSLLGKLARGSYRAHRYEQGVRHPARYARRRVVAKGLGVLGFWKWWHKLWR